MTERDILTLNLVDRDQPSNDLEDPPSHSWNRWEAFRGATGGTVDGLFADPHDRARPKRLRWIGLSLAAQTLVFGLWVLHSVTVEDELPAPRVVKTFLTVPPMTPAPPPLSTAAVNSAPNGAGQPTMPAPPRRLAELRLSPMPVELGNLNDAGAFGLEDGALGGVPGGVIGGLVGGAPDVSSSSEPAPERTIYVVSGEIDRPDKLVHVDPVYPGIATVARVEGMVILEAVIDGEGNVNHVRVLRSIPLLDDAALEAVKSWKYEPTIIAGKPVPIQMTVTVKFALA